MGAEFYFTFFHITNMFVVYLNISLTALSRRFLKRMDTYFVILEFHLQAGFEDAALIVEEADTVGHFRP